MGAGVGSGAASASLARRASAFFLITTIATTVPTQPLCDANRIIRASGTIILRMKIKY